MASKTVHLLLILALLSLIETHQVSDPLLEDFKGFVEKYNKNYRDEEEFAHRFNVYKQNIAQIDLMKKEGEKRGLRSTVGINKFTDMTAQEFNKRLMPKTSQLDIPCKITSEKDSIDPEILSQLPDTFDWRTKGAVTAVKDQGDAGTCWAFSTVGNIEGQWFLAGHSLISLSEEQLSDCDPYDCGVFGGWPCRAYSYVIKAGGVMSEAAYPYCVGNGDCWPCAASGYNKTFCGPPVPYCNYSCRAGAGSDFKAHISNWQSFGQDEAQLAAHLVKNGPISVLMNAGGGIPPLQFHEYGVYNPYDCIPDGLDHAVLLVGYGTEHSEIWGDTPYWLVKNSWGSDWGDEGYFKMYRGTGLCGINTAATSAIV